MAPRGPVWAADTSTELERATAGLAQPPVVTGTQIDGKIVNVWGTFQS
jgi:hypothetical protein